MSESEITLREAEQAASIYERLEQIEDHLNSLAEEQKDLGLRQELNIISTKIKALLPLFDQTALLPLLANQLNVTGFQSKIERLGLSKEIIRLSTESKMTPANISTHLETKGIKIGAITIRNFLRLYENSTYAEKIKAKTNSVFNTADQLESLLTLINTQLGKLSFSIDPKQQENHRAYVGELRQVVKLAADLQLNVHKQIEQTKFQADIRYILLNVCTAEQRSIVIEQLKAYSSAEFEPTSSYSKLPYYEQQKEEL
jgi:ribosomal protein S15P/S13E